MTTTFSSSIFLDINSAHRNRNDARGISDFDVFLSPMTFSGGEDVIAESAPLFSFSGSNFDLTAPGAAVEVSYADEPHVTELVHHGSSTKLQPIDDYYVNAPVQFDLASDQRHTIVNYKPLGGGGRFLIRIGLPVATNSTATVSTIHDPTSFVGDVSALFVPRSRLADNALVGFLLHNETTDQYAPITAHTDSVVYFATVLGWTTSDSFSIKRVATRPIATAQLGSTTTSIVLPAGVLATALDYVRVLPGTYDPGSSQYRRVVSGTSTTTLTLDSALDADPTGAAIDLHSPSRSSFQPVNFACAKRNEMCTFDVDLLHLSLPNTEYKHGSYTYTMSHVYVELTSYDSMGHNNTLFSNNPFVTRALFKVPLADRELPLNGRWVHAKPPDGMTQTILFKDNHMRFRVFMPDGRPLEPYGEDTAPPLPPKEHMQVSALLRLRKRV